MVYFAFSNWEQNWKFHENQNKRRRRGGRRRERNRIPKACLSRLTQTAVRASAGSLHVCPCVTVNQLSFPTRAGESTRTKGQSREGSHGGEQSCVSHKGGEEALWSGRAAPAWQGRLAGGRGELGDSPQRRAGGTWAQGRAASKWWPFEGTVNFFNQLISSVTKTPHLARLILSWNWIGVIDKCLNLGSTLGEKKKYLSTGSSNIIMEQRYILRALLPVQFGGRFGPPSWSPPPTIGQWQRSGFLSQERHSGRPQMRQLSGNWAVISVHWLTAYRGHRPSYSCSNRSGCWPWDECGSGLSWFLFQTSSLCRISMQNLHRRSQQFKYAPGRGYFQIPDQGFNCM